MGITKPGAGRKVTDEDGCAEHQGKLNADAFPLKVGVKYRMALNPVFPDRVNAPRVSQSESGDVMGCSSPLTLCFLTGALCATPAPSPAAQMATLSLK